MDNVKSAEIAMSSSLKLDANEHGAKVGSRKYRGMIGSYLT